MSTKVKAWINLVVFIAMVGVNALGAFGLINDASQSEVSREYQSLITPAGFTFSIWSLIYGLLFVGIIAMILKYKEGYYDRVINAISPLFWASSAFNMAWIITFSFYQIGISTILIFAYLVSLALIVKKLLALHERNRWVVALAFGLNTGWLFIASVVNVAAFLVQIEWNGFGLADTTWAGIMLVVAAVLAVGVQITLQNAGFLLPIAWAFFGINRELSSAGAPNWLQLLALAGMAVLALVAVLQFKRNNWGIYPE